MQVEVVLSKLALTPKVFKDLVVLLFRDIEVGLNRLLLVLVVCLNGKCIVECLSEVLDHLVQGMILGRVSTAASRVELEQDGTLSSKPADSDELEAID
jgi:hypothetical protein